VERVILFYEEILEMEMEVDEGNNSLSTSSSSDNDKHNALFVCCITKKHGLKKVKVPVADLTNLKLEALRNAVIQELNTWEWLDEKDKPKNIDILHTSRLLKTDEDVKRVGPLSVITVIKKDSTNSGSQEEVHSLQCIADYITKHNINDQLMSCSLALRTAFLHPKFVTMIENLGDSEMLENIFAMVPELKNDPVGIGLLQDPTLIFHLSDPEALKKVSNVKPWIIEAFNLLTASIHQERGAPPQGIPSHLFNASMFEGDDESMEDDEEEGGSPGARGGGSRITREQLTAALGALTGGGGAGGPSGSNAFGGLFRAPSSAQPQPPASRPANPNPVAAAGANIQNLMNTLSGAGGGIPGQQLSSEAVARAVTDALRRLTPEQRADQLNAIRSFATQLQQQPGSTPAAPPSSQPPRPVTTPQAPTSQQQGGPSSSSTLAQQYQSQLKQMREMGIMDERLSILALRLSEGDVNTAVELIFSGWTGEGSDPSE